MEVPIVVSASVNLRGLELVPFDITASIGVEPSSSHRRGEIVKSPKTGRKGTRKNGFWSVYEEGGGRDVAKLIDLVLARFESVTKSLSVLPNVTEAELEVFVAREQVASGADASLTVQLTSEQIARICKLGIDFKVTFSA